MFSSLSIVLTVEFLAFFVVIVGYKGVNGYSRYSCQVDLVMVYNYFYSLFSLIFKYFLDHCCICVHERQQLVVFLSCTFYCWVLLLKWYWPYRISKYCFYKEISFYFLEQIIYNLYNFFLTFSQNSPMKPFRPGAFCFEKLSITDSIFLLL